jgi:hypothetical protein
MAKQSKRFELKHEEDVCACGWPLPMVGLRFDDPGNTPDYKALTALLRGVVIQIDCPKCHRVHDDPLGEVPAPHKQPIRGNALRLQSPTSGEFGEYVVAA